MISPIGQPTQSYLSSQWNSILSGQTSGSANRATQSLESLLKELEETGGVKRTESAARKTQETAQAALTIQAASANPSMPVQASTIEVLKAMSAGEIGYTLSREYTPTSINQLRGLQAYARQNG